jgi:hypothetical protein
MGFPLPITGSPQTEPEAPVRPPPPGLDCRSERGRGGKQPDRETGATGSLIARRGRAIVALRPRIRLGCTTKHPETPSDCGTSSRAPAAANDTADDRANCRAFHAALEGCPQLPPSCVPSTSGCGLVIHHGSRHLLV